MTQQNQADPKGRPLTPHMLKALKFAEANKDAVFAGSNVWRHGSLFRVQSSVLEGLARRGLVTLGLSPDGGMMARLTGEGKLLAAAATPVSS